MNDAFARSTIQLNDRILYRLGSRLDVASLHHLASVLDLRARTASDDSVSYAAFSVLSDPLLRRKCIRQGIPPTIDLPTKVDFSARRSICLGQRTQASY